MRNKLWLWVSILCMVILLLPCQVMAHSGRTDANGGHKDNQNKSGLGGYHYHCGGHPAHLHPDGVCPYSSPGTTGQSKPKARDTIQINNAPATLDVGDLLELDYAITYTDQEQVSISSSDKNVIKVRDSQLTAVGEGEATITVQTYNNSRSFSVTVKAVPVEAIQANQDSISLQVGQEIKILAKAVPDRATYKDLTYASSDESIILVDDTGALKAMSPGESEIVITAHNGVTLSLPVSVLEVRPNNILTNKDEFQIEITGKDILKIEIEPDDAANKAHSIECLDPSIISIEDGILTPVKEGTTVLRITTWNEVVKDIPVSIYHIPAETIEIEDSELKYVFGGNIDVHSPLSLEVILSPDTCTYKDVSWTSSDPSVIEIRENQPVICGTGEATLTVQGPDGTSGSITISVVNQNLLTAGILVGLGAAGVTAGIVFVLHRKKGIQQK